MRDLPRTRHVQDSHRREAFRLALGLHARLCLACIRDWRDGGTARDAAEHTAGKLDQARKCPVCRETSYFITPSTSWPSTDEEKNSIMDAYKGRMDRIPCRNFDGGKGHCPFGSSCFYAHVYEDGTRESIDIRKTTDSEGNLNIITGVRLSDFLDTQQGRRAFRNAQS